MLDDALVLTNTVPKYMLQAFYNDLEWYSVLDPASLWDVYDNVFESKLQLKKDHVSSLQSVQEIMHTVFFNKTVRAMLKFHFQLPNIELAEDDYFTALFKYRSGDFLQYHLDTGVHNQSRKVLTANLYLSDCEGGELVVKGTYHRVSVGTLVVFANTFDSYHAVKPVLSQERLVLTYGYVLPLETPVSPDLIHDNTRAIFLPEPGQVFTQEQLQESTRR